MKQKKALIIAAIIITFISVGSFIGFNAYKTSRFNELVKQGQSYADKQDFNNAIACYKAALTVKNDSSTKGKLDEIQLEKQCAVLYSKGDYDEAIKTADNLLKLDSSNSYATKVKNHSAEQKKEVEKKQEAEKEKQQAAEKKKKEEENAKQQAARNASTAAASQDEIRQYVIKTRFDGNPSYFNHLAIGDPFVLNGTTYYLVNYELNIPSRRCNQTFLDYTNKKYVEYSEMEKLRNN